MKKRGIRDQLGMHLRKARERIDWLTFHSAVLATKYTTNYRGGHGDKEIMANFTGNGSKSLHTSVNASLKKLQTDYIDLVCPSHPFPNVALSCRSR